MKFVVRSPSNPHQVPWYLGPTTEQSMELVLDMENWPQVVFKAWWRSLAKTGGIPCLEWTTLAVDVILLLPFSLLGLYLFSAWEVPSCNGVSSTNKIHQEQIEKLNVEIVDRCFWWYSRSGRKKMKKKSRSTMKSRKIIHYCFWIQKRLITHNLIAACHNQRIKFDLDTTFLCEVEHYSG